MTIEETLKQLGIAYRVSGQHEHAREGWVQVDCFQCNSPGHFRLGINTRYLYTNCWMCGPKDLYLTLCNLSNQSGRTVIELIKSLELQTTVNFKEFRPKGVYKPPYGLTGMFQGPHAKYLEGRKFDLDELKRLWHIDGISFDGGRFKWRIFIPIYYQGRPVSWTTRAIRDDVKLRYLSAKPEEELIDHKSLLYGEDYLRHAAIICEGPTDVWRIGPGAVCTFGTGFKMAQVAKMVKYPIRVVCFDRDKGAQVRAKQLCDRLEVFDGNTFNVVLKAKDPGSASEREIKQLRARFLSG